MLITIPIDIYLTTEDALSDARENIDDELRQHGFTSIPIHPVDITTIRLRMERAHKSNSSLSLNQKDTKVILDCLEHVVSRLLEQREEHELGTEDFGYFYQAHKEAKESLDFFQDFYNLNLVKGW